MTDDRSLDTYKEEEEKDYMLDTLQWVIDFMKKFEAKETEQGKVNRIRADKYF